MKQLFEPHIQLVEKVLDLRLDRQNVVMGNIANVNTRGYKPRSIVFEDDLQKALNLDGKGKMTRTSPLHMPAAFDVNGFAGQGVTDFKPRTVYGEDSVDLDKEMGVMAKNSLLYNALTDIMSKNLTGLQTVISEGGR